jgi:hypothetical protein
VSDKNFKVKNGITIQGDVDTVITADNAGGILVDGQAVGAPPAAATPTAQGVVYAQTNETNTLLGLNSSATREGTLATDATGVGEDALASGNASTALGNGAWARGANSTALGRYTQVDDNASIALGADANTNGANQISIGGSVESGNQISRFRIRGMGIDWTSNPVPAVSTTITLNSFNAFSSASDEIYYQNGLLYIGVGGAADAAVFNNAYPVGSVVTISEYGVADTVFTVTSAASYNGIEIELPATLTSGSGNYGPNWVITGTVPTESGKYLTNDGNTTSWTSLPVNLENPNLQIGVSPAFFVGGYNANRIGISTDNASTWQNNSPNAQSPDWTGFAYGNGKNVAVTKNSLGDPTKIYYSADGSNWTLASEFSSSYNFVSVAFGNGRFVAVTGGGQGATSTDGVNWTTFNIGVDGTFTAVVYGGGKFVAVAGFSEEFAYSTDGTNWSAATVPFSSYYWYYATYGNGKFVVANYNGEDYVLLSTDGINWTVSDSITSLGGNYVNTISFGDGKFVIVAGYNANTWTSTDGNSWTLNSGVLPSSDGWYNLTFNGTNFLAMTGYGNTGKSSNGTSWTTGATYLQSIYSIGSGFVPASGTLSVGGNAGTSGQLLQSTGTGVKWATAIPSQTSQGGKYLTTNGINTYWAAGSGKTIIYSLPVASLVNNPYTLDTSTLPYKDIEIGFDGIVGNADNYASITLNATNGSVTYWNCDNYGINNQTYLGGGGGAHPFGYGTFPYHSFRPEANLAWSASATLYAYNSYAKSLLMTSNMFYRTYNYRITENTTSLTTFDNFSYLTGITIAVSGATNYSEGTINIYGIN